MQGEPQAGGHVVSRHQRGQGVIKDLDQDQYGRRRYLRTYHGDQGFFSKRETNLFF